MIAIDTNVVVRIVTQDDPEQAEAAREVVQAADRLWLPKTVLLETEWVLRHCYSLSREVILLTFWKLLGYRPLCAEDRSAVQQALEGYAAGLDFADALHLASSSGATRFATFDKRFAKVARRLKEGPEVELL